MSSMLLTISGSIAQMLPFAFGSGLVVIANFLTHLKHLS